MLSSVMKQMGEAVETVVKEDKDGKFSNTPYVGTLANDGVQLAPFHDLDSQVPADLKSELDRIKKDIVDGKLKVESAASPKSLSRTWCATARLVDDRPGGGAFCCCPPLLGYRPLIPGLQPLGWCCSHISRPVDHWTLRDWSEF
jgi:hypothetical protein